MDPWHWLSVLEDASETELAVFIKSTAHCADMSSSKDKDPESLKEGRKVSTWYSYTGTELVAVMNVDNISIKGKDPISQKEG